MVEYFLYPFCFFWHRTSLCVYVLCGPEAPLSWLHSIIHFSFWAFGSEGQVIICDSLLPFLKFVRVIRTLNRMQGLTCSFLWILELLFDTELCKLRRALYNLSTQLCFSSFRQLPLCEVVPIQIHGTSVSQNRKHDFHLLPLPFVGPFIRLFQNITDFVSLEFFQVMHRYYRNSEICYFVFLNLFIDSSRAIVVQLFL